MIAFYYFLENNILNLRKFHQFCLKTVVLVAIAIVCAIVILATVFVVGQMYQKELFEEYMEDSNSQGKKPQTNPNLPVFEVP